MAVTTPPVPASGTAQPNQTGWYVDVAITGGTMTNVQITTAAGVTTSVGSGAGNYAIPPGASITLTYTVAPTWAWTNPLLTGYTPAYSASNLTLINEEGQLPWPAHTVGGEPGLGEAVSN